MSDLRFAKPNLPRHSVYAVGFGLAMTLALTGILLWVVAIGRASVASDLRDRLDTAVTLSSATEAVDFFEGGTDRRAQLAMLAQLRSKAEAAGIDTPNVRAAAVQRMTTQVQLHAILSGRGTYDALQAFLDAATTQSPPIFIKELSLEKLALTGSDNAQQLNFQLSLYGLALP